MNSLKKSNVEINRKMLAEMAVKDPKSLVKLLDSVTPKNTNAETA